MTDSMKFGPEWLRNMATDMSNNQGSTGGGGGGGTSSTLSTTVPSTTPNNNNSNNNNYQQQQQAQEARSLFPEFRYGREEMLSLFNKNCSMPEILPSFKGLFVEKVQNPLALTPSTEEEVFPTVSQPPTQRPQWLQRSPVAFNTASRGNGRGGSVDRGRMRGKSMYHPIFPRPTPMFEDDARNAKVERNWSERNGVGDPSGTAGTDWTISPSSSPRKDFSGHSSRNLENWRRSRQDEEGVASTGQPGAGGNASSGPSGGSGTGTTGGNINNDGWRGGSNLNNFGNTRWGRSTSWRDDDSGNSGAESNNYNIPAMQRSYSTIATTERIYFSGLSKSSSLTSANSGGGNNNMTAGNASSESSKLNATNNNRQYQQLSANHQWDSEDMLPEWAMENPSDSGGTFDATGAFHGSAEEDEGKRQPISGSSVNSNSSVTTKKSNNSNSKHERISQRNEYKKSASSKDDQDRLAEDQDRISPDNNNILQSDEIEQRKYEDDSLEENKAAESMSAINRENQSLNSNELSRESMPLDTAKTSCRSSPQLTPTNPSNNATTHKTLLTELSDRMQEVADDMVEKLIMDDDVSQKVASVTTTATSSIVSSIATASGKTNISDLPSVAPDSNAPKVATLYKNATLVNKQLFLPVVDPLIHRYQQAAAAAIIGSPAPPPGTRILPQPIMKPGTELWYYRDPQSKVQGPFTAMEMSEWYRAGYFDENLYVRRMCDNRFAALGDLIKMCGQMPFQSSHLIPPLQSADISMNISIPLMHIPPHEPGHQIKEAPSVAVVNGSNIGINDTKGGVAATADALNSVVKNVINPVDISQMLNARLKILQEEYIRRQEMLVSAEYSTKESFNRLTPSEQANEIRQKVRLLGLPEHLTSLAGLSNSLSSLNPTAGNQLNDAITECVRKEPFSVTLDPNLQQFPPPLIHHSQQQVTHQQTQPPQVQQVQPPNLYLEAEEYLQQQSNHQSGIYQNVPYRSAFAQMDPAANTGSGEEQISADILNELNLRIMLRQGRLRAGREQASLPPTLNAPPAEFGAELLSRTTTQILNAPVINMMSQWPPHLLPHGQISLQPVQQHPPTPQSNQPTSIPTNQWPILTGPVAVSQLQNAVVKPPALWASETNTQLLLQQQQQQSQESQKQQQRQQPQQPQQPQQTQQQHQPPQHPLQQQHQPQQQIGAMIANIDNFTSGQIQAQVDLQLPTQTISHSQQQQMQQRAQDVNTVAVKDEQVVHKNGNNKRITNVVSSNSTTPPEISTSQSNNSINKTKTDKSKSVEPHLDTQVVSQVNTKSQSSSQSNSTNHNSNNSTVSSATTNTNKRSKQKSNEKLSEISKSKSQQQVQSATGPTEDERRKESVEEKRKQKEEKKRQQQEEEKKRLQLAEEEKRRQASEEKERQKEIHAHRRKAMLNNNNSSGNASAVFGSSNSTAATNGKISGSTNTNQKQERTQSSVAPWLSTTHATVASTPGPSLAEIQKAERRERRADQQRLLELMEKQMRLAAVAEANDNTLKWNASPLPVKSLAEIQAEEAKRLASEQAANAELQRRKEQEQAAAATAGALNPSNPFAMIWSGSKVWGGTSSTSGFWEDSNQLKFSTSSAVVSSSTITAASVVAKSNPATVGSNTTVANKQSASNSSAVGGNTSSHTTAGSTRNVNKSQAASISSSNWITANSSTSSSAQSKLQQQNSISKQQTSGNNTNENKSKKANRNGANSNNSSSNYAITSNASSNCINKNDDFRNEFTSWCMRSLNNMSSKVDVPTFVTFLQDLESPYEVKDYIRMYLGESKEYTEFAKQFLERRSKYKNMQRAQNAHIDDMCKPAPAINPSGNDSFDNKGKQKKVKKSKMTKLDARILGFSVTAAEGRINVGDRDYGDAS